MTNITSIKKRENAERRRTVLIDFMHARGLNRTAWAKASGVPEASLREFLNGKTESVSIVAYEALAKTAGVSVTTLLGHYVSIIGEVGTEPTNTPPTYSFRHEINKQVEAPTGVSPNNVAAVIVRGNSLYPVLRDNWLVFFHTVDCGVSPECLTSLCVCAPINSPLCIREVRRGSTSSTFNLWSWNSPPEEDVSLVWAAAIIEIRPCLPRRLNHLP